MDKLLEITGIGPVLAKKLLTLINPRANLYDELERLADLLPVAAVAYLKYRPVKTVPREYFDELSKKVLIAGSYRRKQPRINDLDILTQNYDEIAHLFEAPYARGEEVIRTFFSFIPFSSEGEQLQKSYIAVDIFIYTDLAPYLLYATGSKQFNVIMRGIAKKKGYVLNQNGLFKISSSNEGSEKKIVCATEEDIFKKLGMAYLPPEKRNL